MKKNIAKTKKKILDALEGYKKFEVRWVDEVSYSKIVKATSEKEVKEMFFNGQIVGTNNNITHKDFNEYSLEIYEEG